MTRCWSIVAALVWLVAGLGPALAAKRAFVVGIDRYEHFDEKRQLQRAVADAEAMTKPLQGLGFEVSALLGKAADKVVGQSQFWDAFEQFSRSIKPGDTVLVFFSGHGTQREGENFLLPGDALQPRASSRPAQKARSINFRDVMDQLRSRSPRHRIAILDACRDDPYEQEGTKASDSRAGLADPRKLRGSDTFIMYSAGEDQTALDRLPPPAADREPNSPYTRTLLKWLSKPGTKLIDIARSVRTEVKAMVAPHEQVPAYYEGMSDDFCLDSPDGSCLPPPAVSAWSQLSLPKTIPSFESPLTKGLDLKQTDFEAAARKAVQRAGEILSRVASESTREGLLQIAANWPEYRPAVEQRLVSLGYLQIVTSGATHWIRPGSGKTDWFKDCPLCPELVVVPAGRFVMGSPKEEPEREKTETQVEVSIPQALAVGRFAVTRGEFAAFATAKGHRMTGGCHVLAGDSWPLQASASWQAPGFAQDDRHPVVCVNWQDAKDYAAWLSLKTGKRYRLLTESEREYVTRAGTTTAFWWGDTIAPDQASYDARYVYNGSVRAAFQAGTVGVDSFAPNGFGLFGVHGNAYDWTEDCWNAGNAGQPGNAGARLTGECKIRVVRGGSWDNYPKNLRSAFRHGIQADHRYASTGFRVARSLEP